MTAGCWDTVLRHVAHELRERTYSLRHWHECEETDLWYELASCILGSVISFERADLCFQFLRSSGLLRLPGGADELEVFETKIAKALADGPPAQNFVSKQRHPFPFLRARQIRRTAEAIYFNEGGLRQILSRGAPSFVRSELVRLACGIGPKQASLFMRNVGFDNLAVLDRHVIRFMVVRGLVTEQPKVRTLAQYEHMEVAFVQYAGNIGISVAELDLSVWIAMRVLKHEVSV